MRLKKLVKESWLEEKKTLTSEEKKSFLERVRQYNKYGKRMFRAEKLTDSAKELAEMAKMAEVLTLSEIDEDFDKLTVKRNMKELSGLSESFSKTASEAQMLESRMKTLYDDMGKLLERYYEIDDEEAEDSLDEEMPDQHVEKGQGKRPYDGWHANDVGSKTEPKQSMDINEESAEQHVEKGQGKHPYDNWLSQDKDSQPEWPKQSIDEAKKKKKVSKK